MTQSQGRTELTTAQRDILVGLVMRPNGMPVRGQNADVLTLCKMGFVCDPHDFGTSLFTRITTEGRAALSNTGQTA